MNWARAFSGLGRGAVSSAGRLGRSQWGGAAYGAIAGAGIGAATTDGSFLGGAIRGAATGAAMGSLLNRGIRVAPHIGSRGMRSGRAGSALGLFFGQGKQRAKVGAALGVMGASSAWGMQSRNSHKKRRIQAQRARMAQISGRHQGMRARGQYTSFAR